MKFSYDKFLTEPQKTANKKQQNGLSLYNIFVRRKIRIFSLDWKKNLLIKKLKK